MSFHECSTLARQELTRAVERYLDQTRGRADHTTVAVAWIEAVQHAALAMQTADAEHMLDLFALTKS